MNTDPEPNTNWQYNPGDNVSPAPQPAGPEAAIQPAEPTMPAPTPAAPVAPSVPVSPAAPVTEVAPAQPPETNAPAPQPELTYAPPQVEPVDAGPSVNWTASEFVAHAKSGGWYALLLLAIVVIALLVWLVAHDILSVAVIILAGAILGAYAARQPRQIKYTLNSRGLTIGDHLVNLHQFRSFAVSQEGGFSSLILRPIKRFGFLTTIYYSPQDEAKILDILSRQVPHEEHKPDAMEKLLRKIHF